MKVEGDMTSSHRPEATGDALAEKAGELLARIRETRPLVHCLTNPVAMELSANLLLAAGAVPSMTYDAAAQPDFVASSRALVVNLGMLEPQRLAAIRAAVAEARRLGRPWLLDPVKVERSQDRLAVARELVEMRPVAVRGNRAEVLALAGEGNEAVTAFAVRHRLTLVTSGPVEHVTDGRGSVAIANGSPLMDRVTAMGCAATALAGAFLAVEPAGFTAMAATMLVMGVAGELAGEEVPGPGSFVPAFLDAVYALDGERLAARARLA
jgi:hydroxyethylthiazole kinase